MTVLSSDGLLHSVAQPDQAVVVVPAGASGYCECAGGVRARESTCDHGAFKCGEECGLALGLVP